MWVRSAIHLKHWSANTKEQIWGQQWRSSQSELKRRHRLDGLSCHRYSDSDDVGSCVNITRSRIEPPGPPVQEV